MYVMYELHQMVSAGELKHNINDVFEKTQTGPVVILSRATPKAVLVSPEHWNAAAKRLEYLERQYLCDRLSREMDEESSNEIPFTKEELIKRGLMDG
jgi:prevent-host-death family protein